jgi:hypothetical protein
MGEEKKSVRDVVWLWGKLLVAFGALTAAINGYTRLLERQEDMLVVMSTKLNALGEKVAYLEGRLEGPPHVTSRPPIDRSSAPSRTTMGPVERLRSVGPGSGGEKEVPGLEILIPKDPAYQKMPMALDDLKAIRKRLEKEK